MLDYSKQIAICESVRKRIRQALVESSRLPVRLKSSNIPACDSILRAVSLLRNVDTEEKLREFMIQYVLTNLHLTDDQREQLDLMK